MVPWNLLRGTKFIDNPVLSPYMYTIDEVDTSNLEKLDDIPPPDDKKTLAIYYRGGPFFHADYSFIGEVTAETFTRVVFWYGDGTQTLVSWEDKDTITLKIDDETFHLNIYDDQYDFRKKIRWLQ
ncbi:MAG: DUF5412 family protein [Bacillus sp. (in: Bacteria)]|nr:DUF5412 family protein [Bacillus sp. (in: firmicutes)]